MDKIEFSAHPKPGEAWDVIIIGSGPSSLTAAIYTTRGAASTLVLGGDNWGGQLMLTTTVDNFPGFPEGVQGPELMQNMRKQAERFGTKFVQKNAQHISKDKSPFEITDSDGEKYKAKAVIIATGAKTKWLGVPGEEDLRGRGVSSCAPCDAPFFKDKKVCVVGGGDAAMEEALVLTKYAQKVTIIHRRDEFKASAAMVERVRQNEKIDTIFNSEVREFVGKEKLEKVKIYNNKENKESELDFDGAFVAIGHKPDTDIFTGLVELDEKGYVRRSENSKTNIEGIFVAGDVHDYSYRQAITASGFGCMAAMDALKYLDKDTRGW